MGKKVMRRRAADNIYLHKDFHGALNQAVLYLQQKYGEESVRDYLRQFARAFYAPLTRSLKEKGLASLKEYFEKIYAMEAVECQIEYSNDEMTLRIPKCPAVTHIRKMGVPPAELFYMTTRIVNEAICEETPFEAELVEYDAESGRSIQRFRRKRA